jgi:uncharacterized protein (TIRG00374 family)
LRKYIKFVALVLLAAVILWLGGRGINWSEVLKAVESSDKRLLAAAYVTIGSTYVVRSYRWRALLAPLTPVKLRDLFIATTVGFGAFFVFGRTGEMVVRPAVLPLRDPRVRPAAAFITIVIERIYDMTAVVVVFAINLLWFSPPAGEGVAFAYVREAGFILLGGALLGIAGLVWFRRNSVVAISLLDRWVLGFSFVPKRLSVAITSTLEQLARALRILVDARELAVTIGWTALLWSVITLADWFILRAFGLPYGVRETLFVLGWALVGTLVPTPGGAAGAFHTATAAGLVFLGVAKDQAAAVAIVTHLIIFSPGLFLGLYYVLRGEIDLRRLRTFFSAEAVEHAIEDEKIKPAGQLKEVAVTGK